MALAGGWSDSSGLFREEERVKILGFTPIYRLEEETIKSLCRQDYGVEVDWFFGIYNPVDPSSADWGQNLVYKLNKAREITLVLGYSHLFVVESDIVLPSGVLSSMLEEDTDVVSTLWRLNPEHSGNYIYISYVSPNIGSREVDFVGFGCTLIKRRVLEEISFDIGLDGQFSIDCKNRGFKMVCLTDIHCQHITEEGKILEVSR